MVENALDSRRIATVNWFIIFLGCFHSLLRNKIFKTQLWLMSISLWFSFKGTIFFFFYKIEFLLYHNLSVYVCMKLIFWNLNPDPYPPHPTSTYTCEVTIAPRVCGGHLRVLLTSVIRAIINKSFKESFNTNFIGNRKSCQNINNFFLFS